MFFWVLNSDTFVRNKKGNTLIREFLETSLLVFLEVLLQIFAVCAVICSISTNKNYITGPRNE